jgi:addiction module RelE/StbE family toxin
LRPRWTRSALADLETIGDHVARDNPPAAQRLVARIAAAADALGDHPYVGKPGRMTGTRELVVADTPYIVPYRVRGDEVEILAVFHGSRRWPDTFG